MGSRVPFLSLITPSPRIELDKHFLGTDFVPGSMPHFGDERYSRHKVVQALKPSTTLALLVGEKCGLVPCESSRQTRACEISNGEQVKTAEV